MRRILAIGTTVACFALLLTACINQPGDTSRIHLVSSATVGSWHYDYYENPAYPCARPTAGQDPEAGYQTFTVATHTGVPDDEVHPLWVWMHGGGVGYWDASTDPPTFRPDNGETTEQSLTQLEGTGQAGLISDVGDAGFRIVRVSMCDRDAYGGVNLADPNNPNTYDGGKPRTTNGLLATKAAIQYTEAHDATSKFFLHGGSAGSAGVYNVAWGLQQQGLAPAGAVADAGILNAEFWDAIAAQGLRCRSVSPTPETLPLMLARTAPDIANLDNEPDKLVASGRLTVPIAQIWSTADPAACGDQAMACPVRHLPSGATTETLGAADCNFQPMDQAIRDEGPTSRSISLRVCVDKTGATGHCTQHIVTTSDKRSSIEPYDYNAVLWDWVQARLADPPPPVATAAPRS